MNGLPLAEVGHYALILALALTLAQAILPLWGARRGDARLMAVGPACAVATLAYLAIAFFMLMAAYLRSDFSLLNVWQNSHTAQPAIYKLTGTWGNHEGSMLLWVLILALFGALVALFGRNLPNDLRANVLAVQGWIAGAFILFILLTSNPFERLLPAPMEGRDLNPILQDLGLAIHPPLLYLGYVGFSISFSFAVAALIGGRIDAAWARWVRPWTLLAWIFLTAGIAMGSYWAYYELGWGGWWFWDPVENASFMPWLAGTALLHSALVMEKREALKVWTVLLAILTFSLSLLGTFLVRSGVLTSVHSFASDPTRGVFILAILIAFIGGSLALFAWRVPLLKQGGLFAPVSREGALVLNNVFLVTAAATVLVGTLYPLALEAVTGTKISVGPPYFNLTFGLVTLPLLAAVPFGPLLAWKRGDLHGAAQRLLWAFGLAILATILVWGVAEGGPVLAPLGVGLAVWLIAGSIAELAERVKLGRVPVTTSLSRLKGLPRSSFGTTLAHAGIGVCLLGIVGTTAYESETIARLGVGETAQVGRYSVTFQGGFTRTGPNYSENVARFVVRDGDEAVAMEPAKRFYEARKSETTEAAIRTVGFSQLYLSIGETSADSVVLRAHFKPLVTLIWLGAVLMSIAGAVSLSDRRLRIGVPQKARRAIPA